MANKEGKKFEEDFKKSVPDKWVFVRLKDAGGWGSSEETRFTIKNKCDNTIFATDKLYYMMLELKSHLGKSIPKTVFGKKDKHGKNYVIEELGKEKDKLNTFAGVAFNFRDVEETYLVHISKLYDFYYSDERASFSLQWVKDNGVRLEHVKKIKRYRYDLENVVDRLKEVS